jgi:hypothetical protein
MITLTREQKEQVILDYLCYDQIGEYAYGKDSNHNSTEIQWLESRCEWQIVDVIDGKTHIDYESGGCEKAVGSLEDEVLDDMIDNIYNEDELEEMFEDEAAE